MRSVLRYEKHAKLLRPAARLTAGQRSAAIGVAARIYDWWMRSNFSQLP